MPVELGAMIGAPVDGCARAGPVIAGGLGEGKGPGDHPRMNCTVPRPPDAGGEGRVTTGNAYVQRKVTTGNAGRLMV